MILFPLVMLLIISTLIVFTLVSQNQDLRAITTSGAVALGASLVLTMLYANVVDRARNRSASQARLLEIEEMKHIVSEVIETSTAGLSQQIETRINKMSEVVETSTTELSQQVEAHIKKMLEEETTRLVTVWPDLLPKEFFPPSERSNPYFRQKLGEAVEKTQEYSFRGATARFVPTLLLDHAKADLTCKILIIDPRADMPLQIYAQNRFTMHEPDKTIADYREEVRQEIYVALVKLFDLRKRFRIEVRLCHDNLFYRSEMVDDSVFVSFYLKNRHRYPPTYLYTRKIGSFYYTAFHKDFQQSWDAAAERFPMRAEALQSEFEAFLVQLQAADENTVADKITTWRSVDRKT